MRQHVVAIFLTLFVVEPLGAQEEHARFDFPVTVDGQEHILTYDGTHDVMRDADPRVKLVVFVHHGGSQNPTTYFDRLVAALNAADRDRPGLALRATTLVVSAAMIGDHHIADRPARYAEGHYPFWDGGWREGKNSVNAPAVSNYDLLDGMVRHIVDSYPGVKAVVHVGHSAAGRLVSRYSFGTPVYDELKARGIAAQYVVANASSVLYFIDADSAAASIDDAATRETPRRFALAIHVMEDSPLFNAGKGASFTREGTVELDAAIMSGKTVRAGVGWTRMGESKSESSTDRWSPA